MQGIGQDIGQTVNQIVAKIVVKPWGGGSLTSAASNVKVPPPLSREENISDVIWFTVDEHTANFLNISANCLGMP